MGNQIIYAFSLRASDEDLRRVLNAVPKGEFSDVCRKALALWFSADRSTLGDKVSRLQSAVDEIKRILERGSMVATLAPEPDHDVLDAIKQKLDGIGL